MIDPSSLIEMRETILREVLLLLSEKLAVRRSPEEIDPDAPLFTTGLALDSVDGIELVVSVEAAFDVRLPDNEELPRTIRSVNRIVDFIVRERLGERERQAEAP